MPNYYTIANLEKFASALKSYSDRIENGERLTVSISYKNSKMGPVPSVSLLPFITCPACCQSTCAHECYAAKLAAFRATARDSWAKNTAIAIADPASYWDQVNAAIAGSRFFRFHVSGDIISAEYFAEMAKAARRHPHCEILCFTKQFRIVNRFKAAGGRIPKNLHILFSGWENLKPDNPYQFPETNVYTKKAGPRPEWMVCGGNCFSCACRGVGCWQTKKGDTIAFEKH